MPDVTNLINNSNVWNQRNKQRSEPSKCNYIYKTTCPLKEKCQYECLVYKVEVFSSRPNNNNNVSGKDKISIIGST